MGFEIEFHDETYAFAHRDKDLTIHLTQAEGGAAHAISSLYIQCQDADQLAEDWRKSRSRGSRASGLRLRER
jgi:hypothetical protein